RRRRRQDRGGRRTAHDPRRGLPYLQQARRRRPRHERSAHHLGPTAAPAGVGERRLVDVGVASSTGPHALPAPRPPGSARCDETTVNRPPAADAQAARPTIQIAVTADDRMRWWTWISAGGLVAAVVLAVIGGFPLDTPMPTHSFGWVEPTCGLTRGSTAIARGDLALAWQYNPASFAVVAFGLAGIIRGAVGMVSGRWIRVSIRLRAAGWVVLAAGFVALWAHQQSNATFIIHSRA